VNYQIHKSFFAGNLMKKLLISMMLIIPSVTFAHVADNIGGFNAGLSHPVLGMDHLLAMLSVGILSAQMGGKWVWKVPLTFVLVMLIGGMLGMEGINVMSVELGITLSVLILGIAIASEKKLPPILAMVFVGIFAIFHGHAHGTEMPYLADPVPYACGFVAGTAAIHILGVLISYLLQKLKNGKSVLRYLGMSIASVGLYFTINLIVF
jgi:urease accessory protein